jgi:hypothetical protein
LPWVRLDDGFDDHPKVAELFLLAEDDQRAHAALGLHMLALTYCGRKMTNGEVGRALPSKLRGTQAQVDLLVAADLWEVAENPGDGWLIHDFLDYNPSREETEAARAELSQKRSEAGKRGAEARWGDGKNGKRMATPKQRDSPEPEPGPQVKDQPLTRDVSEAAAPDGAERAEVGMLCDLLADAIEAQGVGRRPNPHTKRWHDAARRLLDLDGATVRQVEYVIRWATTHEFWQPNIRSMPKLREKWGTLVLQIKRDADGQRRGSARERAGADMRELQRIADEMRSRGE